MDFLSTLDVTNEQMILMNVLLGEKPVDILDPVVHMHKQVNEHDIVELDCRMKQEVYEAVTASLLPGVSIQIEYGLAESKKVIFYGVVTAVDVTSALEEYLPAYLIHLTGMSYSCMLDQQKKCRAYQNPEASYSQIIQYILSSYSGTNFIIAPEMAGGCLDTFTVQYNETDWEFLKRLASGNGGSLQASSISKGIKFKYGIILSNQIYGVSEHDLKSVKEIQTVSGYQPESFLGQCREEYCVQLTTNGPDAQSLEIGDCIKVWEQLWYVREVRAEIRDHVLTHTYRLAGRSGFWEEKRYNFQLQGTSVKGTVQEVLKNRLKVCLDMESYPAENECWFPYSTFYSLFYCMPEKGDRVNLYFPDHQECHAIVLNSMHAPFEEQADSGKCNFPLAELIEDNQVKIWITKDKKMLILDDRNRKGSLVCKDGSHITVCEDQIYLNTTQEIHLQTEGNICLAAGKAIDLSTEGTVEIKCKDSSITISDASIDIHADDIKMNEG
ncbi:MAG: hypothetical protein GX234_11410 [Clostridiales bacterium]|nr:hypothetical protein [Clostridiales bacterium]